MIGHLTRMNILQLQQAVLFDHSRAQLTLMRYESAAPDGESSGAYSELSEGFVAEFHGLGEKFDKEMALAIENAEHAQRDDAGKTAHTTTLNLRSRLGAIVEDYEGYNKAALGVMSAEFSANVDEDLTALADVQQIEQALNAKLSTLAEQVTKYSEESVTNAALLHRTTRNINMFIALMMIALGALIALAVIRNLVGPLVDVAAALDRLAGGDLTQSLLNHDRRDEVGSLFDTYNNLTTILQKLIGDASSQSSALAGVSQELVSTAQQQQSGSTEQAAAVEETRRTMEALNRVSEEVGKMAADVLENAEVTQRNTKVLSDRVRELSGHTRQIGEVLVFIKEIANKSDLLALNAALEGTKAGEAGKGFSLVANQMQRLAEQVLRSVKDIEVLTSDIETSTNAAVVATEEASKLAGATTGSATRIRLASEQQRSGSGQAVEAVDEIAIVTRESTEAAHQLLAAARELHLQSDALKSSLNHFRAG